MTEHEIFSIATMLMLSFVWFGIGRVYERRVVNRVSTSHA